MIWGHLHPKALQNFQRLEQDLLRGVLAGETSTWFRPFAGYRTPHQQLELYNAGTSGHRPFESPHNYGLAVEFVAFIPKANLGRDTNYDRVSGTWSWDRTLPWDYMHRAAERAALLTGTLPTQVVHPMWLRIKGYVQ